MAEVAAGIVLVAAVLWYVLSPLLPLVAGGGRESRD
jgi:hypothetical protein